MKCQDRITSNKISQNKISHINSPIYASVKAIMARLARVGLIALSIASMQMAVAAEPISNGAKLARDAKKQIGVTVSYDPSYRKLDFPRGDVPQHTGVCSDVVIRAYRLQNIDLQQLINHDMQQHFAEYPKIWRLKTPDKNIDHRRVPNLETFFERHGQRLSITDIESFKAGDIVSWRLPNGNLPHIGIVSNKTSAAGTPLIIHNIGQGVQQEDILFAYPITGPYRY